MLYILVFFCIKGVVEILFCDLIKYYFIINSNKFFFFLVVKKSVDKFSVFFLVKFINSAFKIRVYIVYVFVFKIFKFFFS